MFFFVIEAFGTNAQPASGGCSTQRVWDYPNKHFATQKWRLYIRTPCLLRNFLPYSYYNENPILPKQGIKNAAILIKGCNALSCLFSFLVRLLQSLSPLRLQSVFPYRSYRQAARRAAAARCFSRLSCPGKRIGLRICHNGLQAHKRFAGSAVVLCSQCSQGNAGKCSFRRLLSCGSHSCPSALLLSLA